MASAGRGAWNTNGMDDGSLYYNCVPGTAPSAYDGANPTTSEFHRRVTYGVTAIHKLLKLAGYPKSVLDYADFATDEWELSGSVFGETMAARVKRFQLESGISPNPSGYVGSITMKALLHPHIESIALAAGMAPRFLFGQMGKESGFDPGAQGAKDSEDSGLNQHHVTSDPNSVTLDQAYDPLTSMRLAVNRWVAIRDVALADGLQRAIAVNAAILQHWSPTAAADYIDSGGDWPGPDAQEYVAVTRDWAKLWA